MSRRASEHSREFGKFTKADVRLHFHAEVDPTDLVRAESDLRSFGIDRECIVDDVKYKELFAVSDTCLKVAVQFRDIGIVYESRKAKVKSLAKQLDMMTKHVDIMSKLLDSYHSIVVAASLEPPKIFS